MKHSAFAILLGAAVLPATTHASGHFSSAMHSSSHGSSSRHAPSCHDTSDVVGMEHCTHFGSRWDITGAVVMVFDLGAAYRYLPVSDHVFTSSGLMPVSIPGSSLPGGSVSVVSGDMRFALLIARYARIGVEGSIGGVFLGGTTPVSVAPSTSVLGGGLFLSAGAFVGGGFDVGPWALAVEALVGVRSLNVSASLEGSAGTQTVVTAGDTRAYFEPRLVVEYRALPWTSVGIFAGVDYAGSVGVVAGILLRAHSRAYDGRRDL